MNYLLTPLHHHYDFGFGATADSFKWAADKLTEDIQERGFCLNEHLPINYLYRHAIELYLKSGIVIFHHRLNLSYGAASSDSEPGIRIADKWKSMYKVHSIADLYTYWKKLFADHSSFLKNNTKTEWDIPAEADQWVANIEENDPSSTFFRYPVTRDPAKDRDKSSMKQIDLNYLTQKEISLDHPLRGLLVENEDEEATRAYVYDYEPVQDISVSLKEMAELLYCVHAAMRFELCSGW